MKTNRQYREIDDTDREKAQELANKTRHQVYLCKGGRLIFYDYDDALTYGIIDTYSPERMTTR